MVMSPRRGGLYWYVTDIWEIFAAFPVVVVKRRHSKPKPQVKVRLAGIGARGSAEYEYTVPRKALYKSYKQAKAEASKLNARRLPHEAD